jgi:hypothetical protein
MYTFLIVLFGLSSTSHDVVVEPLALKLLVVFLLTYVPSYFSLAKHLSLVTMYGAVTINTNNKCLGTNNTPNYKAQAAPPKEKHA